MNRVRFDNRKLRGKIYENYKDAGEFAKQIGISPTTMNAKLRGEAPWKIPEAYAIIQKLGIPNEDVAEYFFTLDTGKSQ